MSIEKINSTMDEKEKNKLRLYQNRIEQRGIEDGFMGIDTVNGNIRYVIKHNRTEKKMSTIIVEIYNDKGLTMVGGGYNYDADIALLRALEQVGLKIDKESFKQLKISSPSGNYIEWHKTSMEAYMNVVLHTLGCRANTRLYKMSCYTPVKNVGLTDGFYAKH